MDWLIGHLIGDYLLQTDWMALNKKGKLLPPRKQKVTCDTSGDPEIFISGTYTTMPGWLRGTAACLTHCLLYTLSIMVCTTVAHITFDSPLFPHWPWWALLIVFVTHFIQDRTKIVDWWMRLKFKDQSKFCEPPMAPWSMIVVDNVWHLVILFFLWISVAVTA